MPSFVAISSPQAVTTAVSVSYPAGFQAGDLLLAVVSSNAASIDGSDALSKGFYAVPSSESGGGGTVAMWGKAATGSESGSVDFTASGGSVGVAAMVAYRPDSDILVPIEDASAVDSDSSSTAFSATGPSLTVAAGDLLVFWTLMVATGGTFTSGASGITSSHSASGANASRANGRSGGNTIQYNLRDRIFSGGGTGTPSLTATANGANASGPSNMILFREVSAVSVDAGANDATSNATYDLDATVTGGSGQHTIAWSVLSGPSTDSGQFSSTSVEDPTFTFGGGDGSYVLQVQVTDFSGTDTDTISIAFTGAGNPPTCDAGDDQEDIEPWRTVTLAGTDSDGDGTIVARQWTQLSGATVLDLENDDTATATFTAPGAVGGTTVVFEYEVTDDDDNTASDQVSITVLPVTERAVVDGEEVPMRMQAVTT